MLGGGQRGKPEPPAPAPQEEPGPANPFNPFETWGRMIDAGRTVQDQHRAALEQIFNSAFGQGRRP
jgi:hypothetical protein